jgi:hypothetical protein
METSNKKRTTPLTRREFYTSINKHIAHATKYARGSALLPALLQAAEETLETPLGDYDNASNFTIFCIRLMTLCDPANPKRRYTA